MGTQKQRHIRHKMCLKLQTVADLSRHLDVPVAYLHTLARELDERCEDSSLYKTWERPKKTSGVRCIDAPREKLKWVQKRINERILQRLRVHQTVKGGVRGADLVRHVQSHVGKPMVANFDLENFFSNIRSGRVYDLFSRLGCSPDVSRLLTRLTTFKGRIPQGAPTSTMLANLVVGYTGGPSFSNRLQTLAAQHGGESSIWVDDLTISGPPLLAAARTHSRPDSTAMQFYVESAQKFLPKPREATDCDRTDCERETKYPQGGIPKDSRTSAQMQTSWSPRCC